LIVRFLTESYGVPVAPVVLGWVPVMSSFLSSGQGGLPRLLLPLCSPSIVATLAINIWKLQAEKKARGTGTAITGILPYGVVAYSLGPRSKPYITSTIGPPILAGTRIKKATFPVGKAPLAHNTREREENPDLHLRLHAHR
jgi:hypothetical protein